LRFRCSPRKAATRRNAFFALHRLAAYALIVLIGMHVGAVLLHYIVRNDGVMRRMLPSAGQRA
jgi:cytochrome b561